MQEFICYCKYVRNYFLQRYKIHVTYTSDEQFKKDYTHLLQTKGCKSEEGFKAVIEELPFIFLSLFAAMFKLVGDPHHMLTGAKCASHVLLLPTFNRNKKWLGKLHEEYKRRKSSHEKSLDRAKVIKQSYKPLRADIFMLQESFLAPEFIRLVEYADGATVSKERILELITIEKALQVYSFKVFTEEFTSILVEELENFERSNLPKGRPNTMNNYGILLKEIGFEQTFIDPLRIKYLMPIAKALYPEWVGNGLDSQRSFVVTYKMGDDIDLSYHYDNAEITANISLGKEFSGGELYFGRMRQEDMHSQHDSQPEYFPCTHKATYGILHRGQQMHGAMPIEEGERYNLIIWMRSSSIRNQQCPMCDQKPNLSPVPFDGDGFTVPEVNACVTL